MLCWMPKILVVDLLRVVFSRTPSYSMSLGLQEVAHCRQLPSGSVTWKWWLFLTVPHVLHMTFVAFLWIV